MPSNFTENYSLSQWERTDKVQMEDFNADNAKIDGALAAHAAALALKGNCRVEPFTIYDDATHIDDDNPLYIQFSAKPVLFVIQGSRFLMVGGRGDDATSLFYDYNSASISSRSLFWASNNRLKSSSFQTNRGAITYQVIAFYPVDE